jgi:plastocyanin
MKHKIVALSLFTLIIAVAGCTSKPAAQMETDTDNDSPAASIEAMTAQTSVPAASSAASPVAASGSALASESEVKTFNLESSSFKFVPNSIEVKKGDKVKININNTGGFHDFTLSAFNIKQTTPAGQVTSVEFTADKEGTFEFICGVGNHAQQGQKGTLIVK